MEKLQTSGWSDPKKGTAEVVSIWWGGTWAIGKNDALPPASMSLQSSGCRSTGFFAHWWHSSFLSVLSSPSNRKSMIRPSSIELLPSYTLWQSCTDYTSFPPHTYKCSMKWSIFPQFPFPFSLKGSWRILKDFERSPENGDISHLFLLRWLTFMHTYRQLPDM